MRRNHKDLAFALLHNPRSPMGRFSEAGTRNTREIRRVVFVPSSDGGGIGRFANQHFTLPLAGAPETTDPAAAQAPQIDAMGAWSGAGSHCVDRSTPFSDRLGLRGALLSLLPISSVWMVVTRVSRAVCRPPGLLCCTRLFPNTTQCLWLCDRHRPFEFNTPPPPHQMADRFKARPFESPPTQGQAAGCWARSSAAAPAAAEARKHHRRLDPRRVRYPLGREGRKEVDRPSSS